MGLFGVVAGLVILKQSAVGAAIQEEIDAPLRCGQKKFQKGHDNAVISLVVFPHIDIGAMRVGSDRPGEQRLLWGIR